VSCDACEQETVQRIAYYRWKTATIGMIGCGLHLREIFDVLATAQQRSQSMKKPMTADDVTRVDWPEASASP